MMIATAPQSLRNNQYVPFRQLADIIEATWQDYLCLSKYDIPKGLGYIEGSLEGEKLTIQNFCYQTVHFRKLHLELARVGDRLDILHCVMFPRPNYALPIFGVDLVGSLGRIGAAIVDLSPINTERKLSSTYKKLLRTVPQFPFREPRQLPEWGSIFSEFCLFIRPTNQDEEQAFLTQVKKLLSLHCQQALTASPVFAFGQRQEILTAQSFYCQQQQKNDKTRRVLEKSLGQAWTERYMKEMLFDAPH